MQHPHRWFPSPETRPELAQRNQQHVASRRGWRGTGKMSHRKARAQQRDGRARQSGGRCSQSSSELLSWSCRSTDAPSRRTNGSLQEPSPRAQTLTFLLSASNRLEVTHGTTEYRDWNIQEHSGRRARSVQHLLAIRNSEASRHTEMPSTLEPRSTNT